MQRPEVQAMLRRLSEFDLGIFMPHQHDEQTGDFLPLADQMIQVESGCKVSFQHADPIVNQTDRFLPVAWIWRAGALTPASACEMDLSDRQDGADCLVKHKMPQDK
jgi:hypothetical protein